MEDTKILKESIISEAITVHLSLEDVYRRAFHQSRIAFLLFIIALAAFLMVCALLMRSTTLSIPMTMVSLLPALSLFTGMLALWMAWWSTSVGFLAAQARRESRRIGYQIEEAEAEKAARSTLRTWKGES
ncbi:hypothetical protein [Dyella sp.]|uniref:hypothetical protein n=1 Tax=Dyella sp. TaxID=1869338 RepID=UPI002ED1DD39